MGNKLGRRRQVVDEKYTKPQGLYEIQDVDHKKLRKLILESKLAPCFPGEEESGGDLEECPICFLFYPSLNRSRCCMKSICTECFLQMKSPSSSRPTQCPFCKTSNYAVEYRGVKSKEEKSMEQIEEQRVIEAKIRMRQMEIQVEEERVLKRQELRSSSQNGVAGEDGYGSVAGFSSSSPAETEDSDSVLDPHSSPMIRHPTSTRTNRDDEFDLDLEEIMVMEAIWLSLQENSRKKNSDYSNATRCEQFSIGGRCLTPAAAAAVTGFSSPSTSSRGLTCGSIATLVEQQRREGESSSNNHRDFSSSILPCSSSFHSSMEQRTHDYRPSHYSQELTSDSRVAVLRDNGELISEVIEAGGSYPSSVITDATSLALPDKSRSSIQDVTGPVVPDSFEEQMILAMAVSLAGDQAMSSVQRLPWQ